MEISEELRNLTVALKLPLIKNGAYIYSLTLEKGLSLLKGDLYCVHERSRYVFVYKEARYSCSAIEGQIYNGLVWFLERDDKRAVDSFINFELQKVEELQNKINRHMHKINIFKQIKEDLEGEITK